MSRVVGPARDRRDVSQFLKIITTSVVYRLIHRVAPECCFLPSYMEEQVGSTASDAYFATNSAVIVLRVDLLSS